MRWPSHDLSHPATLYTAVLSNYVILFAIAF